MRLALWLWGRVYFEWKRNLFAWGAYRTRNIHEMFFARTHQLGIFVLALLNPAGWKAAAADRSHSRLAVKGGTQACEERREEQWDEKRKRRRAKGNISTGTAKHGIHLQQTHQGTDIVGARFCGRIRIQPSQSTLVNYLKFLLHTSGLSIKR